jgi:hypothetical protein
VSLLFDLLTRIKPAGRKGDVPPTLKRIVLDLSEKEAIKKKVFIFLVFIILLMVAGVGAAYVIETSFRPTNKKEGSLKIVARLQPPVNHQEELPVRSDDLTPGKIEQLPNVTQEKPLSIIGRLPDKTKRPKASKPEIRKPESIATSEQKGALNKDLYLYKARTFENKKDYVKALRNYKKVLGIDPKNHVIMNNISSILLHLGSFEESIEYSKKALALKKDYVLSLINLGVAYIKLERYSEGEGYLLEALSIESSHQYALFNIALLYEKIGDHKKAERSYYRLSKRGDVQGFLGLARIAEKQDRTSDAKDFYRDIMSMKTIDAPIKRLVNERVRMLEQQIGIQSRQQGTTVKKRVRDEGEI